MFLPLLLLFKLVSILCAALLVSLGHGLEASLVVVLAAAVAAAA